ncbi:MAG: exosome complex RNA-binding protein Rrp4 [Nanoarchaeota archaeon]
MENEEKTREIVVPGEKIASGDECLPGEGTKREGKDILAIRYGVVSEEGRMFKVIPLSGIYYPRAGNVIIAAVRDIVFNGWMMDINAPYGGFLSVMECPRFFDRNDLSEHMGIGDAIACKIYSVKRKGVDVTIKGRGLGKLEDGLIIKINSNKVPRVIGKEGTMINLIKEKTGCNIVVGQNGIVWISGRNIEEELKAKEAILFMAEKSFVDGLTEQVNHLLEKK